MEHPLDINEAKHAIALMRSLDSMRKEGKECDVVLKIGGGEIPVHRNVLRANSDYFDAMFTHDTIEKQSGVVEMKDVELEPVKKCVDFFYSGKISASDDNCEDLLYTASLMQVKPICDKIAPFLENRLGPKTFFKIKKIATKFDLESLNKVCDDFALEELNLIIEEGEFWSLGLDYVSYLISSKKTTGTGSEDPKLALALQWIKYDIESRHKHLIEMLDLINFHGISASYGRYLAEKEEIFFESAKCMRMLYLRSPNLPKVEPAPATMDFQSSREANSICVFDVSSKSLQAFSPEKKIWTKLCPLDEGMCEVTTTAEKPYTAIAVNDVIYVLMANKKIYKGSIGSAWEELEGMLENHDVWISATVCKGCIYVSGNNMMERYDMSLNSWSMLDSGGICCHQNTVFENNGSVYSIGGWKNSKLVKSVHRMLLPSTQWNSVKSMLVARATPAVAASQERIYVAGGWGGDVLNDVESYDSKTNCWTKLSPMILGRSCFSLLAIGGKIYAVGAYQDPCNIEEYDPISNQWRNIVDNPGMSITASATFALQIVSKAKLSMAS